MKTGRFWPVAIKLGNSVAFIPDLTAGLFDSLLTSYSGYRASILRLTRLLCFTRLVGLIALGLQPLVSLLLSLFLR
jgi:hypothetical protein